MFRPGSAAERSHARWEVEEEGRAVRSVLLLDSKVAIGSGAKGRSSAAGLCFVWRGTNGLLLGGGLYPGFLHGRSKDNPADDPSRNTRLRGPSSREPGWLKAARLCNLSPFRALSNSLPFLHPGDCKWVRLVLALCEPEWMQEAPRGWSVRER